MIEVAVEETNRFLTLLKLGNCGAEHHAEPARSTLRRGISGTNCHMP
jgi:hypothetical protein